MNPLERHVSGATVTHESPFSGLSVPVTDGHLPEDVRETWVRPLYFGLDKPHVKQFVKECLQLADDALISRLLANFDWRPRTAAAYLVALLGREAFTTQLGHLLLRSDGTEYEPKRKLLGQFPDRTIFP